MNEWWAVFYGFIQGVTEFLPISSSGHLALIPYFFRLEDPGVFFDLLMHLGTAIAVIFYFNREIKLLISEGILFLKTRAIDKSPYFINFSLATMGSFILILILKKTALSYGRHALFIGFNFIFFGILMYLADRKKPSGTDLTKKLSWKNSLIIGLSQSIAIFPGVSRSGITLTSARYLGMTRLEASRFSFLLSLPVIIGSIIFKLPEIIGGQAVQVDMPVIILGVISSFVFGILTIHFFLKLITRIGLVHFSVYRVIVGALLVYLSW